MPRRYLRRRSLDDAEQEPTTAVPGAPNVAIDAGDARLTELLILNGPERLGGGTLAPTSVTRLQRLAGNRAVADRFGGGRTVQRARNGTVDEEEALPEPGQAGPKDQAGPKAAPPAQAGPEDQAGPKAAPPAHAGPEDQAGPKDQIARGTRSAAEAPTDAQPEQPLEKPAGVIEKATGLDRIVDERLSPIVAESERLLPGTETEPTAPLSGGAEDQARAPAKETPPAEGPSSAAPAPAVPEAPAAPVAEAPAGPTPEGPAPEEVAPAPEEAAPVPEPVPSTVGEPALESMPDGDQAQIAVLNAVGAQAATTAAGARRAAGNLSRAAVAMAAMGFANVMRQTMSRAARSKTAVLRIAPALAGRAGAALTALRTAATTAIRNVALKVTSVADAAKGVIAWARQTLSAARGAARGIAGQIRSAFGGVGEAVLAFLSSLLAPARRALDRLLQAGADVLRDGIRKVRQAAANAVAFVKDEVVTRLEVLLAGAVDLVSRLVRAARERVRRVKMASDRRLLAVRRQLLAVRQASRGMLAAAKRALSSGAAEATRLVATAVSNGRGRLATRRGRRAFVQQARQWRTIVRDLRRSGRSRIAADKARVTTLDTGARAAITAARAEVRAAYQATRTSLTEVATTAATEADELRASVGEAATTATGAIDAAATEAEALIQDVAGEGDRDARELQGLVSRVGK